MDLQDPAGRAAYLRPGLERLEMAYVRALDLGLEEPVALLLDLSDADARAIAEEGGEPAQVAASVAAAARRGLTPARGWGMARGTARDLLSRRFPGAGAVLDAADPGDGYLAIVVASGGFSVFPMLPVPGAATAGAPGTGPAEAPDQPADPNPRPPAGERTAMNADPTGIADATADRFDFLGQWLEHVERNYLEAVELGATEAVVLLLDGRDEHARAVAEAIAGRYGHGDQIGPYVATAVDRGAVPALSWGDAAGPGVRPPGGRGARGRRGAGGRRVRRRLPGDRHGGRGVHDRHAAADHDAPGLNVPGRSPRRSGRALSARPGAAEEVPPEERRPAAMDPLDCMPGSPFRPVDGRWQWARALRAGVVRPRRGRDDGWVRRARRLQEALARRGGDDRHPRLAQFDPPALGAYRLWCGDPRLRREVEARLLAGQAAGAIADRVGVPATVVEAFAALFYDVVDARDSPDWVAFAVFGPDPHGRLAADDGDLLGKLLAYAGGPLVLDAYLGADGHGASAGPDPGISERFRLMAVALAAPITPASAPLLLRAHALQAALDRAAAARSAGPVFAPLQVLAGLGAGPGLGDRQNPPACAVRTGSDAGPADGARGGDADVVVAAPVAVPAPDLDRWPGARRTA